MKKLMLICAAASMMLSGCVTLGGKPLTSATTTEAVTAVAQAGAAIADAQHVTPPSALMSASVKAVAQQRVRDAFKVFDKTLTVIDALHLTRNSPKALKVKHAIEAVRVALNLASSAVAVSNSASYSEALGHAQTALADVTAALK